MGSWGPQCSGTSIYPHPLQLSQSLFERQGLPGPEKLPGSLRKGIPRTKSVGMAGQGAAWGWRTGAGAGVRAGLGDPFSPHPLTEVSSFSLSPVSPWPQPRNLIFCGRIWMCVWGVSPSPNPEILC